MGGEILVHINSEKDFLGYFEDPVATEKKFGRNVFYEGELWYHTGGALQRTLDGR